MPLNIFNSKNVLVVEDDAVTQFVVKQSLATFGGCADIADSGTEAIEKLRNNNYDYILMNLQMPLFSGCETTNYIRKHLKNNIPIVAMTARAIEDEGAKCLSGGIDAYISKPFTIESFRDAIQKIAGSSEENAVNPYLLCNQGVEVDVTMLYDISGNDEKFIQSMVATFLKNFPDTFKKMEYYLEAKDWENLYKTAHFAKSSLSIIKISEMLDWVITVEKNAKEQIRLEMLHSLLEKIKATFVLAKELLIERFVNNDILVNS